MQTQSIQNNLYANTLSDPFSVQASSMTASGESMGLMSCDELIAYLEQRLSALNGRIRDKMSLSNRNADAIAKMNQVTRELSGLGNGTSSAQDVKDALGALLEAHGKDGTLAPDQAKLLQSSLDALEAGDPLSPGQLQQLAAANNDQVDALGRLDSLNLADLQMLVSQVSQATGLVSSMLASFNDSARSVISNMR
jgi:hypothetical protein